MAAAGAAAPSAAPLPSTHGSIMRPSARTQPRRRPAASRLLLLCASLSMMATAQLAAAAGLSGRAEGAWTAFPLTFNHGAPPAFGGPAGAGRRLLRKSRTEVRGSVNSGYYSTTIQIGTPPQAFDVILDTGSSTTFVTCSTCRSCGTHSSPPYDPQKSSTSKPVACDDKVCTSRFTCGAVTRQCGYTELYKEGSSSQGTLVRDVVMLPNSMYKPASAVFGCVQRETGQIFTQKADGLLGLGNSERSLPAQIAASGRMSRIFGLCYGFPDSGMLFVGNAPLPPGVGTVSWTPLIKATHSYYGITLQGIDVGDRQISLTGQPVIVNTRTARQMSLTNTPEAPISGARRGDGGTPPPRAATMFRDLGVNEQVWGWGYGSVLDSGSNMNYLATPAFDALLATLKATLSARGKEMWKGGSFSDNCWKVGTPGPDQSQGWAAAETLFPTLRMRFAGGAVLELPPYRYLFSTPSGDFCLAVFDNGHDGTIIGGVAVRDVLVIYDLEQQRIGFADANCDELLPKAGARGAAAPGAAPATGPTLTSGAAGGSAMWNAAGTAIIRAPRNVAPNGGGGGGGGTAVAQRQQGSN